ncbi:MAG: transcription termination/antitermination NusG family protein [Hyphomicrobium sp.]
MFTGEGLEAPRWLLVRTQPRKEWLADLHLRRQGYVTFFPKIAGLARRQAKTTPPLQPFFPSYLFVQALEAAGRLRSINGTIGVSHLVRFGDQPAIAPPGLIENFIENTSLDGIMGFADELKSGDSVQIVGSAFDGCVGTLQRISAKGRAQVLLKLMQRQVVVSVPQAALFAA